MRVKDRVLRIRVEHQVKVAAVPAVELLVELMEEFRGKGLGDVSSLTDASNQESDGDSEAGVDGADGTRTRGLRAARI